MIFQLCSGFGVTLLLLESEHSSVGVSGRRLSPEKKGEKTPEPDFRKGAGADGPLHGLMDEKLLTPIISILYLVAELTQTTIFGGMSLQRQKGCARTRGKTKNRQQIRIN